MPMYYKFNVLSALKGKGYTTYRIRRDKILSESTVQKLRNAEPIGWENIETLCCLLGRQPGDILAYAPDTPTDTEETQDGQ